MNSCSRVRVDAEILGRGIAGPEFLEEIRPGEGRRDGKCSRNFKNVRFNAPFFVEPLFPVTGIHPSYDPSYRRRDA